MKKEAFDRIYRNVPQAQRDLLFSFRASHAPRHLEADGFDWEYIAGGQAEETLVILPGGLRSGEAAFHLILELEKEYRVIAPTYPAAPRIGQWVDGIKAILDNEKIRQAHLFGSSAGGMVCQCFVRKYPQKVNKLVMGDTTLPDRARGKRYIKTSSMLPFLPIRLVKVLGKRRIPKMVAIFPEDVRAFWQAYLSELMEIIFNRAWITASYQAGIDYLMNYTFHLDDLDQWPGKMLIIESDDDVTIGLEQLKALKEMYPRAQVHTFHNAGHAPALTRENEYIELLRNFLKE